MSKKQSNSPQPRTAARINSKLDKNLIAYMAVAGAAGIGLFAQTAQAEIVYTATNETISGGASSIDLNHDGIVDFTLGFHEVDKALILAMTPAVKGNAIRIGDGGAAPGFFGVPVGAGEKFEALSAGYTWGPLMADAGSYSVTWFFGPWANTTNRYLGLRFIINGETHYGWARLTVGDYLDNSNAVVLTGYAYETIPNKTILEGHTSGPEKASSFAPTELLAPDRQPVSLGMLARGSDGLAIWRRDEKVTA